MSAQFPPKRILVPIDFSKPGLAGLGAAKALARGCGASLDLLYIENAPVSLMGFGAQGEELGMPFLWQQMKEFRQWREDKLKSFAGGFPASRLRVHVPVAYESAPDAILKFAATHAAGLVVMGTHGHTGAGRIVFGSVTEAVVRHCESPVLSVHGESSPRPFSRILAPYNMEPYADQALRYALSLAKSAKAKVTALLVAAGDLETAKIELRRRLETILGKGKAGGLGLEVAFGDAKRVILERSKEDQFDLIVLSAHRKPLLSGFTLGSTAENVLRLSPIPVLAVPSFEEEGEP